jgi:hypothetical protein
MGSTEETSDPTSKGAVYLTDNLMFKTSLVLWV